MEMEQALYLYSSLSFDKNGQNKKLLRWELKGGG